MKRSARRGLRRAGASVRAVTLVAVLVIGQRVHAADQAPKPDPTGTATGSRWTVFDASGAPFMVAPPANAAAPDYESEKNAYEAFQADAAREPLTMRLADAVGHARIGLNFGWTLNTAFLILFMQAGFALLTTGLVRKKNAGHLMMLNFAAYVFAFLAYYAIGYAFQFGAVAVNAAPMNLGGTPTLNSFLIGGGQWGFVGGRGFFLSGPAYDVGANALMMFEVVFLETAGYIIVGAICERITFGAFLLCELFVGGILFPIFGCWVWGGGWMSQWGSTLGLGHGYCDFAGSSVVHAVGGFTAMALALILGPRLGKYTSDGRPRAFRAHNIPFVVAGTFILLFGWMGFNPGSTLGATDLRISVIAVNTNLAAVAGAAAAMAFWAIRFGKPDISMACNGMLAGLVAITASSAFVGPTAAVFIGLAAGVVVCLGVLFNETVVKVDDPCGAIAVHGYCGWLGAVLLGVFADGSYGAGWNGVGVTSYLGRAGQGVTGLLYGDKSQFIAQLIGATVSVLWAFGATFLVFKAVNAVNTMRVSPEAEFDGLDEPEFGSLAYPEDPRAIPGT
jgi:Amt family ammonium transporter